MDRVAIIGLGLMGGSLGLALKARGFSGHISGSTRSAESRATAQRRGAVDEIFASAQEAVRDADLVVFCAPVLAIPQLIKDTLPAIKRGCVLTDVGSTKKFLVQDIESAARRAGALFVGSHPIAGSEKQGIDAARADLYDGATVVITPSENSDQQALDKVEKLWERVGGVVRRMSPAEHDRLVARTSHLPHLTAALLAATVGREKPIDRLVGLCGSGFRDGTRVAEGAPEIWRDILETNHEAIAGELRAYNVELEQLMNLIERKKFEEIAEFLERSRAMRRGLLNKKEVGSKGGGT